MNARLDCVYDSHGNWTSCQQVVQTADASRREQGGVNKNWRRTITCRQRRGE